jgi:organic hydroperoxide reductase OsmC/OhrA
MLTFLALAAKVGVDVRSYDDDVTISLETVDRVTRIGRVRLAPTIILAAGSVDKARDLFDKAHRYCFVANSISCAVDLERGSLRSMDCSRSIGTTPGSCRE